MYDKKTWIEISILLIVVFMGYGFSLEGDFVFDDLEAIVNNDDVKLNSSISSLFKHDFWGANITNPLSHKSYRPLTVFTFRLNNYVSGNLNSTHMKITNFIIYLIVCLLVLHIYKIITNNNRISFISAILFASHPIHSEAVSSIVGRAELLSALFYCLAFISYNKSIDAAKIIDVIKYCTFCSFLALLSLLSKENGLMIIVVCLVYDHLLLQWKLIRIRKFRKIRFSILIISLMALIIWRMYIVNFRPPLFQKMDNHIAFSNDQLSKVLSLCYLYTLNLWLLFCPYWLCCDWSFKCVSLLTTFDLRMFTIPFPWIIVSFTIYYHKRILLIGLIFMIIPFLPASGIITVGFIIAERVLFIPSIGFCLIIGCSIQNVLKYYFKTTTICFTALVCLWIIRTNLRAFEWTNSFALFESGVKVCPKNAKIHYNRALTASASNYTDLAEHSYLEALRQYPEYEQALNNLANLLRDSHRFGEAEKYLRKAIQIRPTFGAAWMNLGIVLTHMKNFSEAEQCYKKSLQIRPNHVDSHYNIGNLYLTTKQYNNAKKAWHQATKLNALHVKSWTNLLTLLDSQGKNKDVEKMALSALVKLPNEPGLHFLLANALGKSDQFEKAEKHFKLAISFKQDHLYYTNLGVLYHRWNKTDLAESMYKEALKINPISKSAFKNYEKLLNEKRKQYR